MNFRESIKIIKWKQCIAMIGWLIAVIYMMETCLAVNAEQLKCAEKSIPSYGVAAGQYTTYFETSELHAPGYWSLEIIGQKVKAVRHLETAGVISVTDASGTKEEYFVTKSADGIVEIQLDFSEQLEGSYTIEVNDEEYILVKEAESLYFVYSTRGMREMNVIKNLFDTINPDFCRGISLEFYRDSRGDEIVNIAKKLTKDCKSDEEKIWAIHSWIRRNITYDYDAASGLKDNTTAYTAEGTFATRTGVCEGQSNLLMFMVQSVGIPCVQIAGSTYRDWNLVSHAWNAVYYNGAWRLLDVTGGEEWYGIPPWKFAEDHYATSIIGFYIGINSIEWGKMPTKTIFKQGEDFECDGKLLVSNMNGTTSYYDIPVERCSGYDTSKLGKQTVTISVAERKFTYEINVVSSMENLKEGDKIEADGCCYVLTSTKNNTLEYLGNQKSTKENISIADTVKIENKTYKVTSIAAYAFCGNKYIKTVHLNNHLNKIGAYAFAKCKNLTQITIPASVRYIGKRAFYQSSKLTKVTIKTKYLTNKKIGASAFKGTSKKIKIKVPKGKVKEYKKLLKKKGASSKIKVN